MPSSPMPCDYIYTDSGHVCRETPTQLCVVDVELFEGVEIQYLEHRCALHVPRGPDNGPPSHPHRPDDARDDPLSPNRSSGDPAPELGEADREPLDHFVVGGRALAHR